MTCNKPLAAGQWWNFCGQTDMGQTDPVQCTHCGGDLIRKEDVSHPSVMEVVELYKKDSFRLRQYLYPDDNSKWWPQSTELG